jgi:hypothetical protein
MSPRIPLALVCFIALGLPPTAFAQEDTIPLAPDSISRAGNVIVLLLPDGGGYQINRQAVPLPDIGQQFRAIYDPRPVKILLVAWGTKRPQSEVDTVVLLAREQGVTVYRVPIETLRNQE